jgi:hypothetical protein
MQPHPSACIAFGLRFALVKCLKQGLASWTKRFVPLDGSELAERALNEALTLGKALGAEVILLQAIPVADDVIRQGGRLSGSMNSGRPAKKVFVGKTRALVPTSKVLCSTGGEHNDSHQQIHTRTLLTKQRGSWASSRPIAGVL